MNFINSKLNQAVKLSLRYNTKMYHRKSNGLLYKEKKFNVLIDMNFQTLELFIIHGSFIVYSFNCIETFLQLRNCKPLYIRASNIDLHYA